jgi:hypothetical protein
MYKKLFIILNLIMFSAFVFADQPVLDRISSGIFSENKKFVYVFWTECPVPHNLTDFEGPNPTHFDRFSGIKSHIV